MPVRTAMISLLLAACSAESRGTTWLTDAGVQRPGNADALRSRTATVQRSLTEHAGTPLAFNTAPDVDLGLFEDLTVEATLDRVSVTGGTTSWIGHVQGWPEREVVISRTREGYVAGIVRLPDGVVRITPLDRELILVEEVDEVPIGADLEPVVPHFLPVSDLQSLSDVDSAAPPIVDVLVAATAPSASAIGGESGLSAMASSLIAQANEGYADSGVGMRLRLAGVHVSTWDETDFTWSDTLSSLATPDDGVLDDVATARDTVGADVVSLLVTGDETACGLGYLMNPARAAFAPAAYSIVDKDCASSNLSFAHEIGHNLGLHHDRDHASGEGATPYAYGYQAEDAGFRTVMAYSCDGASCPRINLWSTPDVAIEGTPAGRPTDVSDSAHNVATMGITAIVAEDFRTAISAPEPEAAELLLPEDRATLGGASLALTWTDAGADNYTVTVGSEAGGADLANLDVGTATATTITELPTDGSTLYVTLWSDFDGETLTDAHTYTAADPIPRLATLQTPTPSSTLLGSQVRFAWTDAKADAYALVLSSTEEGSDLGTYGTVATAVSVSGLPTDGRTIWATLHSKDGDTWRSTRTSYTAFDALPAEVGPAVLLEPTPGQTLTGRTLRFSWSNTGATAYALTITQNGTELAHESGTENAATISLPPSAVSGLLEVQIATQVDGRWFARTYTYTLD